MDPFSDLDMGSPVTSTVADLQLTVEEALGFDFLEPFHKEGYEGSLPPAYPPTDLQPDSGAPAEDGGAEGPQKIRLLGCEWPLFEVTRRQLRDETRRLEPWSGDDETPEHAPSLRCCVHWHSRIGHYRLINHL
ncbi:hypothetical protein AVEN_242266-1 [Araneus ventricosus]|uniref:Uncharacterized protein n=1 Tax=Araneus ventricosus TaxID=182803 RepID=A0A4Y2NWK0_ARAVE|nr:hypothetical protein AVEN_242266-1 [Araneus ventricosus]